MKKSGKIFMWVLIIAIIILIIYVLFISKGEASNKGNLFTPPNNGNNPNPIVTPPPPITVSQQVFSINDKIYAGEDLINTYTSCSASPSNIDLTYKKGDFIGVFLRKENLCIVIAIETYPLGISWIPITGSKEVYLPINALVYKK